MEVVGASERQNSGSGAFRGRHLISVPSITRCAISSLFFLYSLSGLLNFIQGASKALRVRRKSSNSSRLTVAGWLGCFGIVMIAVLIYKRGKIYWYEFTFNGERHWVSTQINT